MTPETTSEIALFLKQIFSAGIIGAGRMIGLALIFPLFSRASLQGLLKNGILVALSFPSIVIAYHNMAGGAPPGFMSVASLGAKEILVGAVLGILVSLPFWAVQMSGDIVDMFRGASAANLFDPINSSEVSVSGTFFLLYALAIFSITGGMTQLVDLIMDSYAVWPSQMMLVDFNHAALTSLGKVVIKALFLAILFAAPLLIAMALADVALIFAARAGRSFPIYDLTNALHNLIFIFMLPFFAILFAEHFPTVLRTLFGDIGAILPSTVFPGGVR